MPFNFSLLLVMESSGEWKPKICTETAYYMCEIPLGKDDVLGKIRALGKNNREVADSRTAGIFIRDRHVFIVIHSKLNHSENMPYPARKCPPYGSPQPLHSKQ